MRRLDYIMVHHSLTKDGETVSAPAIERYHMVDNGWRDVGYHALIELVADPHEYGLAAYQAFMGRPVTQVAAACREGNMNERALHVCVVGNYDIAAPSEEMLTRLVARVLRPWMDEYGIPPERIIAHRDYATYKTCPGSRFDMDDLRRRIG
jgi:N-acetylmuramoyl-L-alanine amidase